MKIAYLIDQFFEHGGIEKILSQKINYWIGHYGYEVILITYRQQGKPFVYPLDPKVQHIDLDIDYDLAKSYFSPANLVKTRKHFTRLKAAIKKYKPDVVISAGFSPDQYFLPYIQPAIPKVKELHASGYTLSRNLGGMKGRLFNILAKYDKVVLLNAREQEYFPQFNTLIIPNFIEETTTTGSDLAQKENIIIAAGRIAPVKQYDHLIKAWALIAAKFPDWKLQIYGAGDASLSGKLQQLIKTNAIAGQTFLMGGTAVLAAKMSEAKIFAMTSETECFPMVLLEAQRAGMVVVSYKAPHGPESIINDQEDGILTPYNDPEQYALALEELMQDKQKMHYLAQNAGNNVSRFSADAVMGQWNDLLKALIKNEKK